MSDVAVGLVALLAGAFLCFFGRMAVRAILSIWGAFVGLSLGGAAVAAVTGSSPFATVLGWVVAILLAVLLAGLAYAFYALAVLITMGSIGYGLGAALALTLGANATVVHVVAIVVAVLLALVALATNLPDVLLIVLTSISGAGAIVAGLMLLVGAAVPADFSVDDVRTVVGTQRWWWPVLYAVAAVGGLVAQSRTPSTGSMRSRWSGGHALHP